MNSKQLGQLGELKAQYDFIAIKGQKTLKIQVKTTEIIHHTDGVMKFSVNSANYYVDKIYTKDDCDYFYLYCLENEQGYLWSINGSRTSRIFLRVAAPKNGQTKGINFAKDFEFFKIIKEIET